MSSVNGVARGPIPGGGSGGGACRARRVVAGEGRMGARGRLLGFRAFLRGEARTGGARGGSRLGKCPLRVPMAVPGGSAGPRHAPIRKGVCRTKAKPRLAPARLPPPRRPSKGGAAGEPGSNPTLSTVRRRGWTHPPVKWGEHSSRFVSQSPLNRSPLPSPRRPHVFWGLTPAAASYGPL